MANNRMYIICDNCKDRFKLANRLGDGYYVRSVNEAELGTELNAFLDHHETCKTNTEDHYSIDYEIGRQFDD